MAANAPSTSIELAPASASSLPPTAAASLIQRHEPSSRASAPLQAAPAASSDGHEHDRSRLKKERHGHRHHHHHAWHNFKTQQLAGHFPSASPFSLALTYFLVALLLVPFGIATLVTVVNVRQVRVRYDDQGPFQDLSSEERERLVRTGEPQHLVYAVPFTVPATLRPPIYLYYELPQFYGGYRRYVRSRDDDQFGGGGGKTSSCSPIRYFPGLEDQGAIRPCGLVAWTVFNDSFALSDAASGRPIGLDQSKDVVAWSGDYSGALRIFKDKPPENYPNQRDAPYFVPAYAGGKRLVGNMSDDPHFMVWMRPSGTVRALHTWARIEDRTLYRGQELLLHVMNNFNTYGYSGEKYVLISEDSWFGGKNYLIPLVLLIAGVFSALMGLLFAILGARRFRKIGDMSLASWNRHS